MTALSLSTTKGFNPPFPAEAPSKEDDSESSSSSKKNSGQRLLGLVRLLEKNTENHDQYMDEVVDLMNNLIALYSRRGLLQGDVAKAERVLSVQKSATQTKRSKKGSKTNELQVHQGDGNLDTAESSAQQQESLVFTAIIRILNGANNEDESKERTLDTDQSLLIALAAEMCVAMSQRIKTAKESDTCTLAEYEMLAQSGKPILTGLMTQLRVIESDIQRDSVALTDVTPQLMNSCLTLASLDEEKHTIPIHSCLKAAASLVSLFGTKLSRSTVLLSDLKTVAWRFVTLPDDSIQRCAARLLASIPLAGGTERKTPSELWNVALVDNVSMLSMILETMAPLNKTSKGSEREISEDSQKVLVGWMSFVREDTSIESARVISFHLFIRGLTRCFQSLLSQDGMEKKANALLEGKLQVESALDVVESFLSYPLSAETAYYKTKKRLRNEAVDGGLISSRAISTQVANQIKLLGHDILDVLLASMGGPALLPFARRITRMSYASLLTSCSGPVRKVMEPTSAVQLDGKKRRWLHLSIPMRSVAITTFKTVTLSFGSDRGGKSSTNNRSSNGRSDGEMAVALVAGCLMEQIGKKDGQNEFDTCWGTCPERVDLVTACADCLRATLISCGGFLGFSIRSLIDSVVLTGLTDIDNPSTLFIWSPVKASLFELASSCVKTPWNDGASSSIVDTLKQAARKCEADMDARVSMAAMDALRACDSVGVPRAPALLYVSRANATTTNSAPQADASASDLIKNLQSAQVEAAEAKKAAQNAETARKEKVEEKRRRDEEQILEQAKAAKRKKTEPKKGSSEKTEHTNASGDEPSPLAANDSAMKTDEARKPSKEDAEPKTLLEATVRSNASSREMEDDTAMEESFDPKSVEHNSDTGKNAVEQAGDGSDDEGEDAFPAIFDGGPDSDDE